MYYKSYVLNIEGKSLNVRHFQSLPSTHLYAKLLQNSDEIIVIIADEQTKGIGRSGNWIAMPGDLLVTYVIPWFDSHYIFLPLICSAVTSLLLEYYGINCSIKWINDVVICHSDVCKKISGNLCDYIGECLVVSFGINVVTRNPDEIIIDMETITNQIFNKNEIFLRLSILLFQSLEHLKTSKSFESFYDYIFQRLIWRDKYVILSDYEDREITRGVFLGISKYTGGILINSKEYLDTLKMRLVDQHIV